MTTPGGRASLQHACLQLYDPRPGQNGEDALGPEREKVAFQFNPRELSVTKSAGWQRLPARRGQTAGPSEFTGAGPATLSVELFLDDTDTRDGSVATRVDTLLSCCVPTPETREQNKPLPPLVVFFWGVFVSFPAFVTQVSARYTLFAQDGTPLRAVCSVSLEELAGELKRQNPTSGSPSARRHHTVVAGDSLASLAHREYGDPTLWRALAAFNDVDDPMRLLPGAELLLPAPEDLLPRRAEAPWT
jgi:hypothetical protein